VGATSTASEESNREVENSGEAESSGGDGLWVLCVGD